VGADAKAGGAFGGRVVLMPPPELVGGEGAAVVEAADRSAGRNRETMFANR
jgi:hypothetical protein